MTEHPDKDAMMQRRMEWCSKGGKMGSREAKRAAILKAWANPDPAKRPGRKKGYKVPQPYQAGSTPAKTQGTALGDDFNRVMEQLRSPE
jgi:hypothetical protein